MSDKDTSSLLKAEEVARRLSVDRSTVTRWAADGLIPCRRLPGRVLRFEPREIEAWVEEAR